MRRSAVSLALCTLALGCATSGGDDLERAVSTYNDSLRWKRYTQASMFREADARADFLARYLAAEQDLNVQLVEVQSVTVTPTDDGARADVVVLAESTLLPSTVVKRTVMRQRWAQQGSAWVLTESSAELAPQPPAGLSSPDASQLDVASTTVQE